MQQAVELLARDQGCVTLNQDGNDQSWKKLKPHTVDAKRTQARARALEAASIRDSTTALPTANSQSRLHSYQISLFSDPLRYPSFRESRPAESSDDITLVNKAQSYLSTHALA
ncbi:hypothetical protein KCU83_g142, partial [Aureobasidium melanogenum]